MRKAMLIGGIAAGAFILSGAALLIYAYFNLTSIIASNQKRIFALAADALGRRVEAGKIEAKMGLGVSVEVADLKIADDPSFSKKPFIAAKHVSMQLEFMPLLRGEAKVTRLVLSRPDVRIVRGAGGALNVDSFGASPEQPQLGAGRAGNAARRKRKSHLAELSISALSVEDATIHIADRGGSGMPVLINHLNVEAVNFSAVAPFDVAMKFAFASDAQNATATGKMGPLLQQGVLDTSALPLSLKFTGESILVERLRMSVDIGSSIPAALSIPDPIDVSGIVQGTVANKGFDATAELTASRVAYDKIFSKPAGTAMSVEANGAWTDSLHIASATLKLLDLELTASRISLGASKPAGAQLDSNVFNLASISPMVTPAAAFAMTGQGEVHGNVTLKSGAVAIDATATLKQVAVKPSGEWPPGISEFNGKIRFADGQSRSTRARSRMARRISISKDESSPSVR
jgi:hypothetical protein